jgi:hypothetical protein
VVQDVAASLSRRQATLNYRNAISQNWRWGNEETSSDFMMEDKLTTDG